MDKKKNCFGISGFFIFFFFRIFRTFNFCLDIFGFCFGIFGLKKKLLKVTTIKKRLLLNIMEVTTEHQKWLKISTNSVKRSFFARKAKKPKAKALHRS